MHTQIFPVLLLQQFTHCEYSSIYCLSIMLCSLFTFLHNINKNLSCCTWYHSNHFTSRMWLTRWEYV